MKETISEKALTLGGRRITYTLARKNVKRINLRVRSDGSVYVSAHPGVPTGDVERFMIKNTSFILNAIDRMSSSVQPPASSDGDVFRLFDETLTIRVATGEKNSVTRSENTVTVTVGEGGDIAQLLERWKTERCREVITGLCRKWYSTRFEAMGCRFPILRFQPMTSRWGSCSPSKCAMTFNTRLAGYPLAAADYVVLHEFTHLICADHSKTFYSHIEAVMPDWKQRKALLKAT